MSSAQLKVQLMLDAIDKVTAPLNNMKTASKALTADLLKAKDALKGLEKTDLRMKSLQQTNVDLKKNADALKASDAHARRVQESMHQVDQVSGRTSNTLNNLKNKHAELKEAIKSVKVPTEGMIAAFESTGANIARLTDKQKALKAEYKSLQNEYKTTTASTRKLGEAEQDLIYKQNKLSNELKEAGINTAHLGKEQAAMRSKLTGATQAVEQQTAALAKQAERMRNVAQIESAYKRSMDLSSTLKSNGTSAIISGGVMAAALSQPIKAFAEAEDAATQLKVSMMGAGGAVAPEFEKVNALATQLGNKLPGTTADFQNMMTALQRNGVSAQSVLAGVGESAAYLAVSLKMPTEEAAVFAAKMKGALQATDSDMMGIMDSIQKGFNLGVQSNDMLQGFSKMSPALEMLKLKGDAAAQAIAPILIQANKIGMAGEAAGNALRKVFSDSIDKKRLGKANAELSNKGIKLDMTDGKGGFGGIDKVYSELQKLKVLSMQDRNAVIKKLYGDDAETMQMVSMLIDKGKEGYDETVAKMKAQADLQARVNEQLGTLKNLWDAATGTFTNALAGFGEAIAPDLKELANSLGDVSQKVGGWMKEHPQLTKIIGESVLAMTAFALVFGAVSLALGAVLSPFAKVYRAYKLFGEFKSAGGGLEKILTACKKFKAGSGGVFDKIKSGAASFTSKIKNLSAKLSPHLTNAKAKLGQFAGAAKGHMSKAGKALVDFGSKNGKRMATGLKNSMNAIPGLLGKVGNGIKSFAKIGAKAFMSVGKASIRMGMMLLTNPIVLIITAIAVAAFLIYKYWDKIVPFVKGVWAKASKAVSHAWIKIKSSVKGGIAAIMNGIKNLKIVQWLKEKWDAAVAMMKGMVSVFMSVGGSIVDGLWNGLKAGWNKVTSWVTSAISSLSDAAKKVLGINSPSKVFMGIGRDTMAGLHVGLEKHGDKAIATAAKIAKAVGLHGTPKLGLNNYAAHWGLEKLGQKAVATAAKIAKAIGIQPAPQLAMAGGHGLAQPRTIERPRPRGNNSHGFTKAGDMHVTFQIHGGHDPHAVAQVVEQKINAMHRAQSDRLKSSYRDRD